MARIGERTGRGGSPKRPLLRSLAEELARRMQVPTYHLENKYKSRHDD